MIYGEEGVMRIGILPVGPDLATLPTNSNRNIADN